MRWVFKRVNLKLLNVTTPTPGFFASGISKNIRWFKIFCALGCDISVKRWDDLGPYILSR